MRSGGIGLAAGVTTLLTVAVLSAAAPAAGLRHAPAKAPRTNAAAARLVRKDVASLAGAYEHKRYRTVCGDLTASALKRLGGASKCTLKAAALHLVLPIRRLTVVKVTLEKRRTEAVVAASVNGNRKKILRAVLDWQAGTYRLASNISPLPQG
ncbi:MAG TPA: hypothetical protein VFA37_10175 [Gaiellaceae bacterium]|nr:hypothetical protein [Gaiellaceae bacterium]